VILQLVRYVASWLVGDVCRESFKYYGNRHGCERTRYHFGRHATAVRWEGWESERY
jgi:hypothetical protein